MLKKPKQFEPQQQIVIAFDELQKAMSDARAAIDRVDWLKDRLIQEFEAIKGAQEVLEIYTEEEAARMLRIEKTHLADMRRRLDLPHCSFGNRPRYTKVQLLEICETLELNSRGKVAARRAA
jgi:hypothetical protein